MVFIRNFNWNGSKPKSQRERRTKSMLRSSVIRQVKKRSVHRTHNVSNRTSLQDPRCASWQAEKIKIKKLTNLQAIRLTDEKGTGCQDDLMTRWQDDKMTRWQDDKMTWWHGLPKFAKMCQMLPKGAKRFENMAKVAQSSQKLTKDAKSCQWIKSHLLLRFTVGRRHKLNKLTTCGQEFRIFTHLGKNKKQYIIHKIKLWATNGNSCGTI